jgi:hypothetical protein
LHACLRRAHLFSALKACDVSRIVRQFRGLSASMGSVEFYLIQDEIGL